MHDDTYSLDRGCQFLIFILFFSLVLVCVRAIMETEFSKVLYVYVLYSLGRFIRARCFCHDEILTS